jgi:hypothetical protein
MKWSTFDWAAPSKAIEVKGFVTYDGAIESGDFEAFIVHVLTESRS